MPGDDGQDEEAAKRRGTRLHLLLEHLPTAQPDDWPQLCARLIPDMQDDARQELLNEATIVLTADHLSYIFNADALAEVPVSANLNGARIHGVIDRLIVTESDVQIIDFKTNATVPTSAETCPEGLLRQMGAYAHALAQIFPGREIRTAILWTRTAQLMWLPHEVVTQALQRAGVS